MSHTSATKNKAPFADRLYAIIEMGNNGDTISIAYDILNTATILGNLIISFALTFETVRRTCGGVLTILEVITYLFFTLDFFLRLSTASVMYPHESKMKATFKYLFSFMGLVDLLSFLPYYLPFIFPAGMAAFRMIRVARIFRLFRINAYYDSLNVIMQVLVNKKQQLLSSVFIIMMLMMASSICMYGLEHDIQPDVYQNAFSGIWWSVSTLLTVGYGDIYPITIGGRIFGILISFLGVGMVAIPTGIISAGFVEQYSKVTDAADENELHFVRIRLSEGDSWCKQKICDLDLPQTLLICALQRGAATLIPKKDLVLEAGDLIVLGANPTKDPHHIELMEVVLKKHHPWIGMRVRDLDISRQTILVMIKRDGRLISPRGETMLEEEDGIILYTQRRLRDAQILDI